MKVFWSWQSDTHQPSGRYFVRAGLDRAVEALAAHPDLEDAERPSVDSDTSDVSGSPPIADTVLQKIRECAVFVADVTPVAATPGGKKVPNPNVMIELGYAIAEVGLQRIVLVMNQAEGARLSALPFDLRHWRGPLTYSLHRDATEDRHEEMLDGLVEDLVARLGPCLANAAGNRPPALVQEGVPADPTDPAVWAGAMPSVRVVPVSRGAITDLPIMAGPKAWCRIIPSAPFEATRQQMGGNRGQTLNLALLSEYQQLWYGLSPEGAAAWNWNPNAQTLNALTQWFQSTGEIWGIWPDLIIDWKEQRAFTENYAARGLEAFLRAHFDTLEYFKAPKPWRVIVGVRGLTGSVLNMGRYGSGIPALSDQVIVERMVSTPSDDVIRPIAFAFMAKVFDAFGAPDLTEEGYVQLMRTR